MVIDWLFILTPAVQNPAADGRELFEHARRGLTIFVLPRPFCEHLATLPLARFVVTCG